MLTDRQQTIRDYLAQACTQPFEWGQMDCAHFAAGLVKLLTGNDFTTEYMYTTEHECNSILRREGGVRGIADKHLGSHSTVWAECKDGDIVLAVLPWGPTLGIALASTEQAIFKTPQYVGNIPIERCRYFWSI